MLPIQITVRSIADSPAVEFDIFKRFGKTYSNHPKIHSCRMVVGVVKKHRHKDKIFSASLDITISGKEIVCVKKNQNLYIAIKDVFVAMDRLLEKNTKPSFDHHEKTAFYPAIGLQPESAAVVGSD